MAALSLESSIRNAHLIDSRIPGLEKVYIRRGKFPLSENSASVFFEFKNWNARQEAYKKTDCLTQFSQLGRTSVVPRGAYCGFGFSAMWLKKEDLIQSAEYLIQLVEQCFDQTISPRAVPVEEIDLFEHEISPMRVSHIISPSPLNRKVHRIFRQLFPLWHSETFSAICPENKEKLEDHPD